MADRSWLEAHRKWLGYVQPVGLLVAPAALLERGIVPDLNVTTLQEALLALAAEDEHENLVIADFPAFSREILRWQASDLAGAPGGPSLPSDLAVTLPEFGETLAPTYAVRAASAADGAPNWQLLICVEQPGADLDATAADDGRGWVVSPQARFERLLRETGVPAGLLVNGHALRLAYAPRGESSGHATFRIQEMTEVAGRPILAALVMLLDVNRLFGKPVESLMALLEASRKFQASVSTKLAHQVLTALHELLRGLHAADARSGADRIRELALHQPDHLYGGLLTALMRLVFVLYAEDRGLFPGDEVWTRHYSLGGLFVRLRDDVARFPDTMDERFGAWSQLLVLWRMIHRGGRHGRKLRLVARRGRLFDPDRFPFLDGRGEAADPTEPPPVSDGTVWRILQQLMVLDGERLSYRTLDVEQIGSVYETMMGFTVEVTEGHALAIRSQKRGGASAVVDLDALLGTAAEKRVQWLQERTDRKLPDKAAKLIKAAASRDDLAAALDGFRDKEATPTVLPPGSPVLQPTDERRRSGSHYTPRALTEPIVREALRPVLERLGPNATPEQILELKVLDPAMGSAAFLVEACRQLAEALVAAWARAGGPPPLPPDEDAILHARRLVAQRCLYGLDRNAMAADLAKLSLWLATLARDHEFTFLDHALRHGDSLIGLMRPQIESLHWEAGAPASFAASLVRDRLKKAEAERARIRTALEGMGEAALRPLLERADSYLADVRLVGDAIVAAYFSGDKAKTREAARAKIEEALDAGGTGWQANLELLQRKLGEGTHPLHPFHWEIEFPEVFQRENPGFDIIVGNPPFMGGTVISASHGMRYFQWLTNQFPPAEHHCDLVAYFYRRAFNLLRVQGCFGLVATKTIAQGDTREGGLVPILAHGGSIYGATKRLRWPGMAAVIVSVVHVAKDKLSGNAVLDGRNVSRISAYLVEGEIDRAPSRLTSVPFFSLGSKIYGQGFLFDEADPKANSLVTMRALLSRYPQYAERILPYIGGEEINTHTAQKPFRWVIYLSDISEEADLKQWSELVKIVREKVKPERDRLGPNPNNTPLKKRWWAYQAHRPELYGLVRCLPRVLVHSRVSAHLAFVFLPTDWIYSEAVCVFCISNYQWYATLQSRVHEVWARFFASSMKDDLRYTPSDCFETFPFPPDVETNAALEEAGRRYYEFRARLMVQANEGLTKTYNRFNDPEETQPAILELRRLHREMDRAVLAAYGWSEFDPEPVFEREWEGDEEEKPGPRRLRWPEATRDEVLTRLLDLNARRAAEERLAEASGGAAAHVKKPRRKGKAGAALPMFADEPGE